MGNIVRKILAAIFFLALAAGVVFTYYKMFINPVAKPSPTDRPRPSGYTIVDTTMPASSRPSASQSHVVKTTTPAPSTRTVETRSISGKILDYDSGNPIPGFAVMLLGQETDYFAESLSGTDGTFGFPELPQDSGDNFILRASQKGYYLADISVLVGDRVSLLPVASATLQGHITDPNSPASISDARVSINVLWEKKEIPFYCTSDNRGDYSLPSLPPGIVVSVVVFASPYVPEEHVPPNTRIRLLRNQAVIHNISLMAGVPIAGVVKNKDGDVLIGALIFLAVKGDSFSSLRSEDLRNKFYYLTNTDDKGRFVLPPAPADGQTYDIIVFFEGYKLGRKSWDGKISEIELEEGDDPHPLLAPQP